MSRRRVVIVGGGAAGFFAAIACAETGLNTEVTLLEKGPEFLTKVRISGGGRCNVTHACFDPRELAERYPRGGSALISPFQSFQPQDTVAWFEARGVKLKTEKDGRIFPVTDSSQTIIDCLVSAARAAGAKLETNCGIESAQRVRTGGFELKTSRGTSLVCERLLLATGGCRSAAVGQLAVSFGHTLEPPVPSLFSFEISTQWLRELAGVAIDPVEVSVQRTRLRERGPVLITHRGLSGPAILRLSAWGARLLHDRDYRFPLLLNWLPLAAPNALADELEANRSRHPSRHVVNTPMPPLAARLWEQLVLAAGIDRETRWANLPNAARHRLVQQLTRTELPVTGKSLNKEEFVTCGGVRLSEVRFDTLESRLCPGLHFAGELLDIDGITGGFNFQSAWTTGWLAGRAMAAASP
jgi:predicted Rossmann fold flavoprotein